MYERALSVLPFYMQNNEEFNHDLEMFVQKQFYLYVRLVTVYAWRGSGHKIKEVFRKLEEESANKQVKVGDSMMKIINSAKVVSNK